MSYRTRIPGSAGKELSFDSRRIGQETVEAVGTSIPFVGGGAPIMVESGRRRRTAALSAALAPARKAEDGSRKDTEAREPSAD